MNIIEKMIERKITVSAMESCTGGYIASAITDVSGASEIFCGSFVTYSNRAKILNGVDESIIKEYGVYSAETAEAMAKACASFYGADAGIGVTGSLGRVDPNNSDSVSGVVYFSVSLREKHITEKLMLPDNLATRNEMKKYVADRVFEALGQMI